MWEKKHDVNALVRAASTFRQQEKYLNFAALAEHHKEGIDFTRDIIARNSLISIIAPHGGTLEAGTSEIAEILAGENLSLYCFNSNLEHGDKTLRISSIRFDDPECLGLLGRIAVTIHGSVDTRVGVFVGGRNDFLQKEIIKLIKSHDILSSQDKLFPGTNTRNICNRCTSGEGVQLEFSLGFREKILAGLRTHDFDSNSKYFDCLHAIRTFLSRLPNAA